MKSLKENRKGITLVSLVITIVVLLILASIATYSGIEVIKSSRLTTFTTEMKIMQTQVNELYQRYKDGDNTVLDLGKDLDNVSEQANKVFTEEESGITDQNEYRYFDQNTIKNVLKIEGVEGEFFVNIKNRSVVSYQGFQYEGKTYYTLDQLPDGLYNVEYMEKNINVDKPTFDTSVEKVSEGKWRVTVSNIQYNGYINKWKVNYQLEGQNSWNTSEDLSFIVNEQGNYHIKIVNGNVESDEKERPVWEEYVGKGIILYLDGINNTRNGHNDNATVWEDLSGNNNDGQFINLNGSVRYLSQEQGYEFTDNNDYIQSVNNLGLEGDKDYTLEFVYKSYGYEGNQGVAGNGLFWFGTTEAVTGKSLSCFLRNNTNENTRISWMNYGINSQATTNDSKKHTMSFRKKAGLFNQNNIIFLVDNNYNNNIIDNETYTPNIVDSPIQLGRGWQFGGQNRTLNGMIYAVRIYNRVLTDEEIKNNYEIDKLRFNLE